ncbi:MAG: hypothetical protein K5768_08470 [Firmicutes bacterium]|nr:hypothetical protein [Bacillota bacterium]
MKIKDLFLTPECVVANSSNGFQAISVSNFTNRETGESTYSVEILSRGHSTVRVKLQNPEAKTLSALDEIKTELLRQAKVGKDPVVKVEFDRLEFKAWALNGNSGVSGSAADVRLKDDILLGNDAISSSQAKKN